MLVQGNQQPKAADKGVKAEAGAVSTSDKAAKRAEASKRCAEKRKAAAKAARENALVLRDELTKRDMLNQLSEESKRFVLELCADTAQKAAKADKGTKSNFNVLFGDNPKVGDSISFEEAVQRSYQGLNTIDRWVKTWAGKGIMVDVVKDMSNLNQTRYTVKALPAA